MRVKAKVSFAGAVCMAAGEVRDIPKDVAAPLLECGYLEKVKERTSSSEEQNSSEDS